MLLLLPALVTLVVLAMYGGFSSGVRFFAIAIAVVSLVSFVFVVHARLVYPLRTLANLIGALREEDYSIRIRSARGADAMEEVTEELNRLTESLREQRLGAVEAAALVRAIIAEIDSAIFAFDAEGRLQVVNRSGERLLGRSAEQIQGRHAGELGLEALIDGEPAETAEVALPGATGRWMIRRSKFRQRGEPHRLLVMSDLSRTLREEERLAWQRLLRVLGHELNNSLAPIRSIAISLQELVAREERPSDWLDDVKSGLSVIGSRATGLSRFMEGYAKFARLPRPVLRPLPMAGLVNGVVDFDERMRVVIRPGSDVEIDGDREQLEQLLINLVRNAVDASMANEGEEVAVSWTTDDHEVEIMVIDDGAGISGTANLFIPFFTTKPGGSGVGLALSRYIAEAHGGTLTLENREAPQAGAIARLRLPRRRAV
ncbi:MAG: ATP-binding protein [Acidobacteriota bacterium]